VRLDLAALLAFRLDQAEGGVAVHIEVRGAGNRMIQDIDRIETNHDALRFVDADAFAEGSVEVHWPGSSRVCRPSVPR
jgi:hypothetical protein